ncbi:biotin-dependent carboxyltransferase family protein [Nitrospira moscoviensis]|uniref:Putative hydrolase subunit n=1 Tax=Nitrospira moscoviensis TaxID=42253 RepID=A0A0K2GCD8_NITMO|nr:biotin-dependent carboxyltransferase family protein [Nitrospira moscoviensis]ALA58626.1 putative hydrolase subunit [Nitrospira moscoviensis]
MSRSKEERPASLLVVKPGWFTTVQDLGRHGHQQYGMPVSGAMDRVAHVLANRLAGNRDQDATLEITLKGPELLFEQEAVIALAGADLTPTIDGREISLWTCLAVQAGSRLSFGARRAGGRCYLAVAGGLDVPIVLGSRATHVASRTGGFQGRVLLPGDRLTSGRSSSHARIDRSVPASLRPRYSGEAPLRILPCAQRDAPMQEALAALTTSPYRLSSQSNRMGYRLDGPPLGPAQPDPTISDGTAMGMLQVPPDGRPILLMADRQTTGGYPRPAVVITADLPLAGQLVPGDAITFTVTSLQEARTAFAAQWDAWDNLLPPVAAPNTDQL